MFICFTYIIITILGVFFGVYFVFVCYTSDRRSGPPYSVIFSCTRMATTTAYFIGIIIYSIKDGPSYNTVGQCIGGTFLG